MLDDFLILLMSRFRVIVNIPVSVWSLFFGSLVSFLFFLSFVLSGKMSFFFVWSVFGRRHGESNGNRYEFLVRDDSIVATLKAADENVNYEFTSRKVDDFRKRSSALNALTD